MIEKLRNKIAKTVIDFMIDHVAAPGYSRNIKTLLMIGEYTWRKVSEEAEEMNESE